MNLIDLHSRSVDRNLNSDQQQLKAALLPAFKRLRALGYSLREIGAALADHFQRAQETITTDRAQALLQDPETLVLGYRQANGRANTFNRQQTKLLQTILTNPEQRTEVEQFLVQNFVVDVIPPGYLKPMALQAVACRCQPSPEQLTRWRQRA